MLHQCPGCLEYIVISSKNPEKPPIAYIVDDVKKKIHLCKQLKEIRKWYQELKVDPTAVTEELENIDISTYIKTNEQES